jgi:hypothetical protein
MLLAAGVRSLILDASCEVVGLSVGAVGAGNYIGIRKSLTSSE